MQTCRKCKGLVVLRRIAPGVFRGECLKCKAVYDSRVRHDR